MSVQNLVDEILIKNITPDKYGRCVLITFFTRMAIYCYIFFGCFGSYFIDIAVVNKSPRIGNPIEGFVLLEIDR